MDSNEILIITQRHSTTRLLSGQEPKYHTQKTSTAQENYFCLTLQPKKILH